MAQPAARFLLKGKLRRRPDAGDGHQAGRSRPFTQQDPIGLAGGANVYGFASGDPVNFADPFGLSPDTLEYGDADAERWVTDEEAKNPEAKQVFDKLRASPYRHVIFNADKSDCDACPLAGWTVDTEMDDGADWQRAHFPGARTVTSIRPSNPDARKAGIGTVVWHEGVHAVGVPEIGRKYRHGSGSNCDKAFIGVPGGCSP